MLNCVEKVFTGEGGGGFGQKKKKKRFRNVAVEAIIKK